MRISRGTERRLTCKATVYLPSPTSNEAALVVDRELHEQVVLLSVVDGVTLAHLACRQKTQRTATRHRPRFCAEHRPNPEASTTNVAPPHEHAPVDTACLSGAGTARPVSIARFVTSFHENDASQSDVPAAPGAVHAVHGRDLRQPRCSRRFFRRGQDGCRDRYVFVHIGQWLLLLRHSRRRPRKDHGQQGHNLKSRCPLTRVAAVSPVMGQHQEGQGTAGQNSPRLQCPTRA